MAEVTPNFKAEPDGWTMKAAAPVVLARSRGYCEARTPACTGPGEVIHHRKGRLTHDPDLLLHCCEDCHLYAHAHPEESYKRGWMVRRV